jgi:CelD/BcsL family acetyltransferase involved in cellulose biosynthesis
MVSLSARPDIGERAAETPRDAAAGTGLAVSVHDGREAVLAAIQRARPECVATAFQSGPWLSALFAEVLPAMAAHPILVEVKTPDGACVLLLPLVAMRERGLNVLSVPSFGLTDYGGPILGSGAPPAGEVLWPVIKRALAGHDLLLLENMPRIIGGRTNPLVMLDGIAAAGHHRNALQIEGTVEEFLRGLGKKYRKEVERCGRLLAERGTPRFHRAETVAEVDEAYAILEEQQAARRHEAGGAYLLDRPEYSRFYRTLLRNGTETGTAHLFTLGAGAEVGACLLGVTHGVTFKLLRISTAGGEWKRISPGRLIVVEAMRHFVPKGVRRFDMGIGDYPFKQGFGIVPEPLFTLEAALTAKAWPRVALSRTRRTLREIEPLRRAVRRLKGHGPD